MRVVLCVVSVVFLGVFSSEAQEKKWTPPPVGELLGLIPKDPKKAGEVIRKSWGKGTLESGRARVTEGTSVLWAVMHEEEVRVVRDGGELIGKLVPVGEDGFQALAVRFENFQVVRYEVRTASGKVLSSGEMKMEVYDPVPESVVGEGVPRGKVTRHVWNDSKVFPGTLREYEVYVSAQYDGSEAAALMVFQDGLRHGAREGSGLRATNVMDNLIAAGEMPVTVGVFIDPGRKAGQPEKAKPANRGFEYDSLGDAYVRFLLEEILPAVERDHGVKLSGDPKMRAIAGGSSGASCAWTAAWERPDEFGKVLGWVGSFVDLRGAHAYPPMIRKSEKKPIRVALLGERNDLDNQFGNWPLANMQMEKALAYKDYDYKYWWGDGFHGSKHAAVMLPEMMRWLWKN